MVALTSNKSEMKQAFHLAFFQLATGLSLIHALLLCVDNAHFTCAIASLDL